MEIKLNGEIRQIKDGMTFTAIAEQGTGRSGEPDGHHTPEMAGGCIVSGRSGGTGTCDRRRLTYLCAERKEQQSSEELCRISETGKKEKQ